MEATNSLAFLVVAVETSPSSAVIFSTCHSVLSTLNLLTLTKRLHIVPVTPTLQNIDV